MCIRDRWVNDELIIRADRPCVWYENGQRQEDTTNGHSFADQCGLEGFIGSAAGLNLLTEVLQTPDQGCYVRLQPGCYTSTGTNNDGISGEEVTLVDADPDACIGLDTGLGDDGNDRYRTIRITEQTPFRHVEDSLNCDVWNPANPDLYEEPVELGIAEGAKPSITTYDRDKFGYYFYWKALNMGHWWDKWAASMALGDPAGDLSLIHI